MYDVRVTDRECRIEYAGLQFGGLFGLGSDYYPLPWDVLTYDTEQGGYVVDLDKKVLEQAPRYGADSEPTFDRDYGREFYGYYRINYPFSFPAPASDASKPHRGAVSSARPVPARPHGRQEAHNAALPP